MSRHNHTTRAVQAKHQRLGLNPDGKLAPFRYATDNWFEAQVRSVPLRTETRWYKPTCKESLEAACQADRIFKRFHETPTHEDRVRVARNWIRWQMRVHYEQA